MQDSTQENASKNLSAKSSFLGDFLTKPNLAPAPDISKFKQVFHAMAQAMQMNLSMLSQREMIVENRTATDISSKSLKQELSENDYVTVFSADAWGGKVFFLFPEKSVNFLLDSFYGAPRPQGSTKKNKKLSTCGKLAINEISRKLAQAVNKSMSETLEVNLVYNMGVNVGQLLEEVNLPKAMYKITFRISVGDCKSQFFIVSPHKCYSLFEQITISSSKADLSTSDVIWKDLLQKEVQSTDIHIEASIALGEYRLSDLAEIKIGQILKLPSNAFRHINIATKDKLLYIGSLGKTGKNYAIKLDKTVGT